MLNCESQLSTETAYELNDGTKMSAGRYMGAAGAAGAVAVGRGVFGVMVLGWLIPPRTSRSRSPNMRLSKYSSPTALNSGPSLDSSPPSDPLKSSVASESSDGGSSGPSNDGVRY